MRAIIAMLAAATVGGIALAGSAAAQQGRATSMPTGTAEQPQVQLGIDMLAAGGFAELAGLRIGLLANQASRDAAGRRTVDVLAKAPGVKLVAL